MPIAAAALLVVTTPAFAAAAEPRVASPGSTVTAGGRTFTRLPIGAVDKAQLQRILDNATGAARVNVLLQLSQDPLAVADAQAQAAGTPLSAAAERKVAAGIGAQQADVVAGVRAAGGTVRGSTQHALNSVSVSVSRTALAKVAALPGVVAVHPVTTAKRTASDVPSPLLGVPSEVWDTLGYDGSGVKIGIIDSGIDYTHADFAGVGTAAAYAANDRTVIEPGTFPTAKVAGGYDFVGDAYNAATAGSVPVPDPDPLDCDGHGTHVAGIAAGEGVTAGGNYSGPYTQAAYDATSFVVSPGVAPKASLYALKVFGCAGSVGDDVVISAIDWAVAHDLDVINLSLGSAYGVGDDAETQAIENAAAAGVVSVISAGNDGDSPYIVGAPSTAPAAISVAAVDRIPTLPSATLTAGADALELQVSNQVAVPSVSAPLAVLTGSQALGCDPADYADKAGKIVVTLRGNCDRVLRAKLGQQAGVAAVVMVNSSPGYPPLEGPIDDVTIPFLGATPEQGEQLAAHDGETVTLAASGGLPNPSFGRPASFTSSGPGLTTDAAKPDVTAPGVSVVSAGFGTGTGPLTESGTSMSAPFVAGVAALVRQARPALSVAQVKAAIVNTADPSGVPGYSTVLAGSGLVDPDEAITTPVLAYNGEQTSLSLGYRESTGAVTAKGSFRLRNTGSTAVTYTLSDEASLRTSGATTVAITPSTVTVAPGAFTRVDVSVRVEPGGAPSTAALEAVSGSIVATPGTAAVPSLRVPYLLVPKNTSAISADHSAKLKKGATSVGIGVRNSSPVTGTADVYSWGASDDDSTDAPLLLDAPDVRAVGVSSFPADDVGIFAVSLNNRLSNAAAAEADVVVDTDRDGTPDYIVVAEDNGLLTAGAPDGVLGAFVITWTTRKLVGAFAIGGGINTSVIELPFLLSDIGLDPAGPTAFDYVTSTFSLFGPGRDDVDGVGSFDAYTPSVETGQFTVLPGGTATTVPAAVDPARLAAVPSKGWLVVSLEDRSGAEQADTVRLK